MDSDLPVVAHLPNLTHRLISVTSFSKTIQQELAHPTYQSRRPQASPSQLSFSPGSFSHPDLLPWQGQWAWHYWQHPPSNLTQKSTRPLSNKKRTHRFLPDIFLYKDNKGCQYALSGSQPGPSEPRRQKVRRIYIFPGGNLTQACNYKRCRTQ